MGARIVWRKEVCCREQCAAPDGLKTTCPGKDLKRGPLQSLPADEDHWLRERPPAEPPPADEDH